MNQKLNTLNNLLSGGAYTPTLQQVLDTGDTAAAILTINAPPSTITNVMRYDTQIVSDAVFNTATHQTDGFVASAQPFGVDYGQLLKDRVKFEKSGYLTEIINTGTELDINGQVDFNNAPHAPDPVNGNDLANKGYVDSLVGQYSGGFNFFLNYSVVDGIYRSLGQSVVAAAQQVVPITTDTTNQLVASFVSSALGITSIPSGIWNVLVFSEVAAIGGVLTYFFEVYQLTGAIETLIFTSGNSTDVNATTTPTAFGINGTLTAPYTLALTDKIVIKIYLHKDGTPLLVNTYFQNAYYSFVQSTLNAGTTLLSSNNTFTGTNKFTLGITAPSLTTETAVALNIGTTTATSLNLGRAGINTAVAGNFQTGGIDRATAGTFSIGGANATAINLNNRVLSGITYGVNSFVTLSANTTAPTSSQIGYRTGYTAIAGSFSITSAIASFATLSISPGCWLVEINLTSTTGPICNFGLSTTAGFTNGIQQTNSGAFTMNGRFTTTTQVSGAVAVTYNLIGQCSTTSTYNNVFYNLTRIA
jgi:hypothetical protein